MRQIFLGTVVLVVLAVLGAAGYWYFNSSAGEAGGALRAPPAGSSAPAQGSVPNTTDYSDPNYHFKISYPTGLNVHVYDEDGGARTITFEDASPGEGFQIFIVPYSQNYITPERFKTDDPSGVMTDPQDIAVDGAPAKIFYGYNDQMGDTREVWFIHGGFLYEVTTYKALDDWLGTIMLSWRFLP